VERVVLNALTPAIGRHNRLEDKTIHLRFVSPRRAHHRLEDKTIHLVERVVLNALLP
jgi:hypothetical protein